MNDNFRMAEDPAENAKLFVAMTHAELVANCLAATEIVAGQIARAEHNVLRANVAIRHAAGRSCRRLSISWRSLYQQTRGGI